MATVFDKILDKTTGPKSYNWYKKEVEKITTPGARSLINTGKATLRPKYGIMNLFGYDPKYKETLPYYDRFPLIFPLEPAKGGFRGLNFHYLQPGARVAFLRQLAEYASDSNFDKKTRYNIDFVNNSYFKRTTKHYLFSQVRTSFLNIPADEMAVAIFLPVARFKKGSPY
ncbi:MAG: hypothetical protein CMI72_04900 [Candidatus Pelagibacter sp.]|nr:hypothetical protein [Candidatus Pelagibacter sp.]|tara:strand:+ start:420 stop:929 length:510 start_codon:yes stop_codon:yes gene_type:complete